MIYVVWEFKVGREQTVAFEKTYKSDGIWAELFRRDSAYRETILLRDFEQQGRYLTIDVWESRESYSRFKERFAEEYRRIDGQCERLTSSERLIGVFAAGV